MILDDITEDRYDELDMVGRRLLFAGLEAGGAGERDWPGWLAREARALEKAWNAAVEDSREERE